MTCCRARRLRRRASRRRRSIWNAGSYETLQAARERYLVIGEVLVAHVRDGVIDPATLRVDRDVYAPIGRLFGGGYVRTHDRFEMPRLTYREWLNRTRGSGGAMSARATKHWPAAGRLRLPRCA